MGFLSLSLSVLEDCWSSLRYLRGLMDGCGYDFCSVLFDALFVFV